MYSLPLPLPVPTEASPISFHAVYNYGPEHPWQSESYYDPGLAIDLNVADVRLQSVPLVC